MAPQTVDCYPPTAQQKEDKVKAFVDSTDPIAVCDAASGSYNVCFFVEFVDENTKWVSEVATMRYLESKTTIPLPHVCGFGRGGTVDKLNPTGLAYIILEYIPGHSLDILAFVKESRERKAHFYSQLIDILAQLRQQEFDYAGSLLPDPDGGLAPILGPSLSMQLNELQIDQGNSAVPTARFASAVDFAFHQYHILDQKYRLPASDMSELNTQLENHGPFVLAHTDLRWSNIIVDEDLNIQGVIDWEWASTVPRQFFMPPTWIARRPPDSMAGVHYRIEYRWFYDILEAKAATSEPCHQLAEEWGRNLMKRVDLPLAVTLRHHNRFLNIYYRGVYPVFYKTPRTDTVNQFFERDGKGGPSTLEVKRRLENSERYTQYLTDNNLFVPREATKRVQESPGKRQEPDEKLGMLTDTEKDQPMLEKYITQPSHSLPGPAPPPPAPPALAPRPLLPH
ncbi:kinase-like domain-containing protein [Phialemonium atrogriseum]|uniref:Kinase-like domain-containing protein n=1 Tax=Phialemonium atrogriseum TaxID=1093897 RepID=A0AAJ0FIJ7_9PEZI|nr:kinase-like domain-containing protein [Phialemonium atrogriseum]KAK1768897.1 kinase-like domain-containing protein [Phialemonium atrogriseum]